ncbi:hypothetical protein ACFSQ7_17070 [Paenibacillus rhizoplanae]
MKVAAVLEAKLTENYELSLKEFYVLLFLSEAPEQKAEAPAAGIDGRA